jgi:hypothetical protein
VPKLRSVGVALLVILSVTTLLWGKTCTRFHEGQGGLVSLIIPPAELPAVCDLHLYRAPLALST